MGEVISVGQIVSQYRSVVGALGNMFKLMGERSEIELWRVDGVGSCRNMDKESSEYRLEGPARAELILLRKQRNATFPGRKGNLTDCPYFRERLGCVLGDLKSPYCIAHVDYPASLNKYFEIDGYQFMQGIHRILAVILTRDEGLLEGSFLGVTDLRQFPQAAKDYISDLTTHIESQPILSAEERPFLKWMRLHTSKVYARI